jgi:hypothetical protein
MRIRVPPPSQIPPPRLSPQLAVQHESDSGEPVGVVAKPQEPRSSSLKLARTRDAGAQEPAGCRESTSGETEDSAELVLDLTHAGPAHTQSALPEHRRQPCDS